MDRNSVIGITLIAVIFIVYLTWFAPKTPPADQQLPQQSVPTLTDTVRTNAAVASSDTIKLEVTKIETDDLSLEFNNHGVVSTVELKKFKTYYQKPLYLANPDNNQFKLDASVGGKAIDLYNLLYVPNVSNGDTTVLTYTANVEGGTVKHIYKIPKSGYEIGYQLQTSGLNFNENLTYRWRNNIPIQEKQLDDSRIRTTTNWYSVAEGFDNISENSLDYEIETVAGPVSWASFRQKFFLSAIIAKKSFAMGEFSTVVNGADTAHVKDASVKLAITSADVANSTASFRYFFGPNDYRLLGDVKDVSSFERNVYLGWPPVKWVNQFIILPIFHVLESFISNYGVIIMILVLIIRLLLTPLSYSSYLGMAKMRLLKPELDLIKQKNGDNQVQTQQDTMKLYQQAGVNPLAGCIPLLLQLPILLAMFYFFPVSVEFRQEAFLWAEDLSTYDSIATLPFAIPGYGSHVSLFVLLMTISTLISTWQNNQVSNVEGPMKSVSYIMPVVFLFVLNSFSAALSFYYFVSNVFGFLQQILIRKFVDEDKIKAVMADHKKKLESGAPATGGMSKFMAKLDAAKKASEEARKKSSKK